MGIQWSLVLFTVLAGCGGWLAVCAAYDLFAKKTKHADTNVLAAIVAVVLLAAGGVASVTHLAHPENMLNALNHPGSGIFTEAVLVGLSAAFLILYIILAKREAGQGLQKAFALIGAVLAALLSFTSGYTYLMPSVPAWNTILLPIGYLCTSIPSGVAAYILVAGIKHEDDLTVYVKALVASGCIAVAGTLAYAAGCGEPMGASAIAATVVSLLGGAAAAVCGYLAGKDAGDTAVADPDAGSASAIDENAVDDANGEGEAANGDAGQDDDREHGEESADDGRKGIAKRIGTGFAGLDKCSKLAIVAIACSLIGSIAFRVVMWTMYVPLGNFISGL